MSSSCAALGAFADTGCAPCAEEAVAAAKAKSAIDASLQSPTKSDSRPAEASPAQDSSASSENFASRGPRVLQKILKSRGRDASLRDLTVQSGTVRDHTTLVGLVAAARMNGLWRFRIQYEPRRPHRDPQIRRVGACPLRREQALRLDPGDRCEVGEGLQSPSTKHQLTVLNRMSAHAN